mgnify:CR=1 FL=1
MVKKNLFEGKRCFIIGTGTTLDGIDLSLLENEITIGINLISLKKDFVPDYLCVADTTVIEKHYDIIFNDKMKNSQYVICNGCLVQGRGNCYDRPGSTCRGFSVDDKKYNIYQVKHSEKSGIFENHINSERTELLKTDEYYIDEELKYITSYGGSTVDNLAIPLAVYLGFKEIYLLGCDGGWNHFYDSHQKAGKREWINYKHVIKKLDSYGVSLLNCDRTNVFEELKYINYEELMGE